MADYEVDAVEDDMDGDFLERRIGHSESDDDEYGRSHTNLSDTTSVQARKGRDIQGIPWDRLNITREKYRQTRLEQYKNYENIPNSGEESEKECQSTEKGSIYYEFRRNTISVK